MESNLCLGLRSVLFVKFSLSGTHGNIYSEVQFSLLIGWDFFIFSYLRPGTLSLLIESPGFLLFAFVGLNQIDREVRDRMSREALASLHHRTSTSLI